MKRIIILFSLVCVMMSMVIPVASAQERTVELDTVVVDLEGNETTLRELADGEKMYLKFTASWCTICTVTMKETEKLYLDKDKDFKVIVLATPGEMNEMEKDEYIKWATEGPGKKLRILFFCPCSSLSTPTYIGKKALNRFIMCGHLRMMVMK